ncbi:MAG: hypothetical protein QOJ65_2322 [Fimbriimonadaceae bacterium]|nr:hypothetical protein [Fimbriimonadaceae bacterium]
MLNPHSIESVKEALREVDTPAPPPELLRQLQGAPRQSKRLTWALPAALATAVTIALIATLTLRPAVSLAQVAAAFDAQEHYTITNTRLMNGGTERTKNSTYRDGPLWRSLMNEYGLEDKTLTIRHYPPVINYVLVDSRRDPPTIEFRIDRLLRQGATPTVERNVLWNGRRVDRFRLKDTYRNYKVETYDQEIIVDPKARLPIQMTVMRDNGQWGDVWDYDFRRPPVSVFHVEIPKDAKVYNLPSQRKKLTGDVAKNRVAELIVGDEGSAIVLARPTGNKMLWLAELKIDGVDQPLRGSSAAFVRVRKRVVGQPATISIGGRTWRVLQFTGTLPGSPSLQSLLSRKEISGTLTLDDQKIRISRAKVLRTGMAMALLRSFDRDGSD